jgi:hypothetical protein
MMRAAAHEIGNKYRAAAMPLAKKILMGQKGLARISAMEKVKEGNMTLRASLRASCRQTKYIRSLAK